MGAAKGNDAVSSLSKLVAIATITLLAGAWFGHAQPEFKCATENATCRSLIGYKVQNSTTLRHIQTLFGVKHLPDILGANNLPSNLTGTHRVSPNETIKIPFPCKCGNGTGLSNGVPEYTIKQGDTLDNIATKVFGGLMKYPQIQAANKIPDANNITAGDKLWIPLPCSCDEVDGSSVVHYAHLVESGSSVEAIALQYGTTQKILLDLNGISDPKTLQAGQILDVPLKACSSSVKSDSLDYPLLVPNATYVYTANECVKCKCDSTNNFILQCDPSNHKPTNWSVCPSMECSNNVFIGNITSSDSCNRTSCDYTGYSSRNISTILETQNICAVPPSSSGGTNGTGSPGSGASRIILQGWAWNNPFIVVQFILFFVYLL